jgi:hypothetical protein
MRVWPCGIGGMTHGIHARCLVALARLRLIEVIE